MKVTKTFVLPVYMSSIHPFQSLYSYLKIQVFLCSLTVFLFLSLSCPPHAPSSVLPRSLPSLPSLDPSLPSLPPARPPCLGLCLFLAVWIYLCRGREGREAGRQRGSGVERFLTSVSTVCQFFYKIPLSLAPSQTHTHTLARSLSHPHTRSLFLTHTHTRSHTSQTHTHTHSLSHTLSCSLCVLTSVLIFCQFFEKVPWTQSAGAS